MPVEPRQYVMRKFLRTFSHYAVFVPWMVSSLHVSLEVKHKRATSIGSSKLSLVDS